MKHQNIVMFCQQSWDIGIATSAKSLAKEFAKNNRVLYVNMPLDVNTVLTKFGQVDVKKRLRVLVGKAESLVQADDNLWVLTPRVLGLSFNWLPLRTAFNTFNLWNSKLLADSIGQALQALGFESYHLLQDGIIFQGLELKRLLSPSFSVYYLRDHTITFPYFRRHGPWVEAQLLRQADLVVVNSAYLCNYASQYNANSIDIGQGCIFPVYEADAEHPMPADLANVPRPSIMYTGYLTALRLDIDLLLAIAQQRPQWNLVLIGPEDEVFRESALHKLPNVHFLGLKAPEQLATCLHHSDVCINPQLVNEITIGNYPLKIDEYLMMGKPVVATSTFTMEDLFAEHVYLASTTAEWLQLLEVALADTSCERRRAGVAFAKSHTWEATADLFYAAVTRSKEQATPDLAEK